MKLQIDLTEADLLKRVLTSYLSDLREEIGKTENFELRQSLKRDEELLKSLIERLGGQ